MRGAPAKQTSRRDENSIRLPGRTRAGTLWPSCPLRAPDPAAPRTLSGTGQQRRGHTGDSGAPSGDAPAGGGRRPRPRPRAARPPAAAPVAGAPATRSGPQRNGQWRPRSRAPAFRRHAGTVRKDGSSGEPTIRGPKIPEALRKQLQAQLDARVDADVAQTKALRGEAIGLLTKFVGETPREAREMPEALVRLGELQWENARESFVDRFQDWEKKPVDTARPGARARLPGSRAISSRACCATTPGSSNTTSLSTSTASSPTSKARKTRRAIASSASSATIRTAASSPTPTWRRPRRSSTASSTTQARSSEYEKVLSYKDQIDPALYGLALFKSAWCYWRLGNNDEAARRFVGVFEATDAGAGGKRRQRRAAQAARRAPGRGPPVHRRGLHRGREEHRAGPLRLPDEDRRRALQRQDRPRARRAVLRPVALRARHRGLRAPHQARARRAATPGSGSCRSRPGYAAIEDYGAPRSPRSSARSPQYTTGGPWSRTQGDPANVAATTAAIEKALRDDATSLHARAQKDKASRAEFEGAAGLYDVYLSKFGQEPKAYEVHFDLAEIDFFRLDKNLDAATHYMAAAKAIPAAETSGPLATMRHDALYNALVALSREMEVKGAELEERRRRGARRATTRSRRPPTSTARRSTSTRSSTRRTPSCRRCSTARAATTSTPATTTRR